MREELDLNKRVAIYGSQQDIDRAKEILTSKIPSLQSMNEPDARIVIQNLIDTENIKASILFDGNTVWSFNRIIKNIKRIKKAGVLGYAGYIPIGSILSIPSYQGEGAKPILSDYLYHFLSLSCGSIAHYNKAGWIAAYPTVDDLRRFFMKNEFGQRVKTHLPGWETDVIRIVEEIEHVLQITGGLFVEH